MLEKDEVELVWRSRSGDRFAYGELVERYRGRVHALASLSAGRACDAQDLTQETFLRAYEALGKLRRPDRFGAWLYGILRTTARELRRLGRPRELRLEDPGRWTGPACRSEASVEQAERAQGVRRAIAALPEESRVVVTLRFLDGWTSEAIAQHLGRPAGTIRSILSRARPVLRERLKEWTP
ncbi:MAG: sigma-70 family RNA polymerase sigma factor [Planctomycetes bacterium]|nr:sigma-70 family RNA polymerase sigma factor [Planctomycetota bacterium]